MAQAERMEIIVDIYQAEDGRPAGTVRATDQTDARPFSGNLAFLALVESLYRTDDRPLNTSEVATDERTGE